MINIRFISSVELQKVMADLGERLTEEEVQTNKKINTKRKKNEKIQREIQTQIHEITSTNTDKIYVLWVSSTHFEGGGDDAVGRQGRRWQGVPHL